MNRSLFALWLGLCLPVLAFAAEPFDSHGRVRVSKSRTHLEHTDGTPFFFLADTCWTGPALSDEKGWAEYLADRKKKGFTAIQFNMVSPWRTAPTDAEGRQSYIIQDGKFRINEEFYSKRLDARFRAINEAGLLAVPVLCWGLKKGDAGIDLTEEQILELVRFQVNRYKDASVMWILAGDNRYASNGEAQKWQRIGRAVFGENPSVPVTTHPTGENWPWNRDGWEQEKWLTVLGYQSGHGDSDKTLKWLHGGPPAEFGKRKEFTRPVINLEPPYEAHHGYQSKKPHSAYNVRRAVYWSLLSAPVAGVTYGGHGVWSWHTKPGEAPTDHPGSGPAKPWNEAMNLPGATEMGHVRKLFESLPWTQLRPAQHLITQTSDDPAKFVACAATPDAKVIVVYYPIGGNVVFQQAFTAINSPKMTFFDPRTGTTRPGTLTPPNHENDWILVIRK